MTSNRRSWLTPRVVMTLIAVVWIITTSFILADTVRDSNIAHDRLPWGAIIGLVGLALLVVLSLIHVRRELETSAQLAYEASARSLDRVIQVTEVGLGELPLHMLLDEMAKRVRSGTDADTVMVLVREADELVVRAVAGEDPYRDLGVRVPDGVGLVGRVATRVETLTVSDVTTLGSMLPSMRDRIASAAAAPMIAAGEVVGVLLIGNDKPTMFDESAIKLVELAADRIAKAVDTARLNEAEQRALLGAEHARRHLRLLGDASRIFMQSVDDYEPSLRRVIDLALRDLASFGAIVLTDEHADLKVLVAEYLADSAGRRREVGQLPQHLLDGIRSVMATGRSHLATRADPLNLASPDGSADPTMQALGLTTYVVAPVLVRGLAFGVIVLGTTGSLRGFRRSDQSAIEELTRRAALAIEASLLYREALASAMVSSEHLQRLRSVIDVWLGMAVAPDAGSIIRLAAEGACGVLGARTVDVLLTDGSGSRSGNGDPLALSDRALDVLSSIDRPSGAGSRASSLLPAADRAVLGAGWIAAPIRPSAGAAGVIVVDFDRPDLTAGDESLLVLLTQIVSACLANAALHQSTQQSEARVSALLAASPAPIIALSPQGAPVDWNPAASALYGWHPTGWAELPAPVADAVSTLTRLARNGAETCQVECQWRRADGPRSLLLMLAPIAGPAGEIEGFILVTTDDTSRRRLADQFHQSQRLEVVGRLAGGVAHDFNNLLTVIIGYADGLLRKFEGDDPVRRRVEAIYTAGTHAAELTRELLTISRHQIVRPVVLDPAAFVVQISGMLERIVGDDVHLQICSSPEPLGVRIDPMQLEQIMLNLAANARDAMPDGGRLMIEVGEPPPSLLSRSVAATPGRVAISISDTGTGMDSTTLMHCLEPFFTTKQAGRGTGLGLAAVLGIVDQSGGELWINSEIGAGTTVRILLPSVSDVVDVPSVVRLPTPMDPVETRIGTVLVVDDDLEIRGLVTSVLHDRGYKALVAHSGPAALQIAADYDGAIDLLLTDVSMPAMSGVELARALRTDLDIPVLFMSGFAEEFGVGQLNEEFAGNFIAKPFTPDDLVLQVARAIDAVPTQPSNR